jgi:hypothetical protein
MDLRGKEVIDPVAQGVIGLHRVPVLNVNLAEDLSAEFFGLLIDL